MQNSLLLAAATISVFAITGCQTIYHEREAVVSKTSMANPAAVYCVEQGGQLNTISENDQRVTYCTLPNGEEIEQWTLYRENHQE